MKSCFKEHYIWQSWPGLGKWIMHGSGGGWGKYSISTGQTRYFLTLVSTILSVNHPTANFSHELVPALSTVWWCSISWWYSAVKGPTCWMIPLALNTIHSPKGFILLQNFHAFSCALTGAKVPCNLAEPASPQSDQLFYQSNQHNTHWSASYATHKLEKHRPGNFSYPCSKSWNVNASLVVGSKMTQP